MKKLLLLASLLVGLGSATAQQSVPREDALKAAFLLCADLKQMLSTPIPTDPDVKRPVAVRADERGGMVLPETKLSAETVVKAGKEVVPVGQLWLRRVVPVCDGQPAKLEKLHTVTVGNGDRSAAVILCALGVRKNAEGKLELLVYGKDKEPLLAAPLKPITTPQENPIELSSEPQADGAAVTLRVVGKYEATFSVAPD